MNAADGPTPPSGGTKAFLPRAGIAKLRKRHIVETLAAFIGGGWLLVEVVERLLAEPLPSSGGADRPDGNSSRSSGPPSLVWRWFASSEKRPGSVLRSRPRLSVLATAAIDLSVLLEILGIRGKALLVGVASVGLGIVWLVLLPSPSSGRPPRPGIVGTGGKMPSGPSPVSPHASR